MQTLPEPSILDLFPDQRPAGQVVGQVSPSGARRLGCDIERRIAIDHGALRFQPLITPGWGRQGIAYGPFVREAGLALIVAVTNGHNTSQGSRNPEDLVRRLWRWARGPDIDPVWKRMVALLRGPRRRGLLRRFAWWIRSTGRLYNLPEQNESLAVGWFTSAAPNNPLSEGCGFIIHAALGENGELWARVGNRCLPAFRRLQNLTIYYAIVLREHGAIYYAAAAEGAHGLSAFPKMRPIAIDPFNCDASIYAGVHQSVLGQIGFRVDTRVHGVHIGRQSERLGLGIAHTAHLLTGSSPLPSAWRLIVGSLSCTIDGAVARNGETLAVAEAPAPSSLLHVLVKRRAAQGSAGLVWRFADSQNFWRLELSEAGASLRQVVDGVVSTIATDPQRPIQLDVEHSVQITDGFGQIGCYLDGDLIFDRWIIRNPEQRAQGVGIWFARADGTHMRSFEAHPFEVPIPKGLGLKPLWFRRGDETLIFDNFAGRGGLLAGSSTPHGNGTWERVLGHGVLDLSHSGGAKVRANVARPNPGRTFFALPWSLPDFADLEMKVTPPGTGRGEKEGCRCGLVFWENNDNYICFSAYLADEYEGASVALFTKRHGFEELYDAVWTMVADKIYWGRPFHLRVAFDGNRFTVLLNGEPVLERALTDLYPDDSPLRIAKVGIAINWEWGDDTGSVFDAFWARA